MRLVELEVGALPGIDAPYRISDVSPHVTVVVGPNASGKSSLARALMTLWRQELHASERVDVTGVFEQRLPGGGAVAWRARRLGPQVTWERNGVSVDAPPPPPEHLLHSYLISVETLMADGDTDAAIGDRLHKEMSGGYDLPAAQAAVSPASAGHQRAARELEEARRRQGELERARAALWSRRQRRGELSGRQAEAAARAQRRQLYERALKLAGQLADLGAARAQLAAYPPVLADLTGREGEELEEQRRSVLTERSRRDLAAGQLQEAREAEKRAGLGEAAIDRAQADQQERAASALADLAVKAAELERREAEVKGDLSAPWRLLGAVSEAPPPGAFDPANLDAVEAALGERLAAAAQIEAARAELDRLDALRDELRAAPARAGEGRPAPALGARDGALDEGELRGAQAALSGWLAAPPAPPPARTRLLPSLLLMLAALLFGLAGVLALGGGSLGALSAGPGAGARLAGPLTLPAGLALPAVLALLAGLALVAGAAWTFAGARGSRRLQGARSGAEADAARAMFGRSGAQPPFAWEHDHVAHRLEELLTLTAERREMTRREASSRQLTNDTLRQLAGAESRLDSANQRLRELARATGYDAGTGDGGRVGAGFASWLRAARQVNDLSDRLRGIRAERRRLERQADELYAGLVTGLAGTPQALEAPTAAPACWQEGAWRDSKLAAAAELRLRSERLGVAVRQRDEGRAAAERYGAELARAEAALAAAELARAQLLEGCGLGAADPAAEARLHALLLEVEPFRAATERVRRLEAAAGENEEALREAPEILEAARAGDGATLELGLQDALAAAREQSELSEELGALDEEVRAAERQRLLEEAGAQVARHGDAVRRHLRQAQLNVATALLFEDVEHEHRAQRQPEVLKRAQVWFERFTHHAFRLEFEPNAPRAERLRARDSTSGRLLAPGQLSTGTRAQLLLALRVAHATCAEGEGARLPFFLDEALTTADARRFAQVAASLLELAEEDGRQLLYLSARHEDAAAWSRAAERAAAPGAAPLLAVVDLAEVRRLESAARWEAAPTASLERPIPDPNEVTVAEFAAALGVTPIDPWQEPSAVHLFHLRWGDLTPLRRLAQGRILTAGQARGLLQAGHSELLGEAEAAALRRRLAGLEAWHDAWRCGRNFPLDALALRRSGAVSETFLEEVTALAAEVGGDPRELLTALAEGRVRYYRASAVEALEEWLDEHGYIDTRPRMAEGERIVATALAMARAGGGGAIGAATDAATVSAADAGAAETAVLEAARQLVERLEAALMSEKERV